ncbi:hypothetical protein KCP77_22610 [Salmonella enterica subsp. enterica]|nr:hypothetical protein KCP77_22610 [Salmonella enterica subsp. enterica]
MQERFLRVADILEKQCPEARAGSDRTFTLRNYRLCNLAMIEKAIGGRDALPNISDAERIFSDALRRTPARSRDSRACTFAKWLRQQNSLGIEHRFARLCVSLLGEVPDSINAALICREMSIAIMAGLTEARGHARHVIDR